jgi:hypothetical protein
MVKQLLRVSFVFVFFLSFFVFLCFLFFEMFSLCPPWYPEIVNDFSGAPFLEQLGSLVPSPFGMKLLGVFKSLGFFHDDIRI